MTKLRRSNRQARSFFRSLDLRLSCDCCGESFNRKNETFMSGSTSGTLGDLSEHYTRLVTKKDPHRRSKWTPTHESLLSLVLDTFGYELPYLRFFFSEFKEKIIKGKAETLLWKKSVQAHSQRPLTRPSLVASSNPITNNPMLNILVSPSEINGEIALAKLVYEPLTFTPLSVMNTFGFESTDPHTPARRPKIEDLPDFDFSPEKKLFISFI